MKKKLAIAAVVGMSMMSTIGCTSSTSSEAGKRVDALDDSLWEKSEWISVVDAPVITGSITWENERAADGCSWFVSGVKNEKEVASARWMTTGLGVYDIYVNGTLVGDEFLKPGFTHYAKTRRSFTYDVTDLISKKADAENFFSAEVTPGWWADKIITPGGHDGMLGKKVAFRSVLELTYSDGSKEYFGTNTEDWKAGIAGPVKHAAIFDGEEYDARELPGYAVADVLGTPEVNTEFSGEILPSEGAEIYLREDLALEPKQAYTWSGVTGNNEDAFDKGTCCGRRYSA